MSRLDPPPWVFGGADGDALVMAERAISQGNKKINLVSFTVFPLGY